MKLAPGLRIGKRSDYRVDGLIGRRDVLLHVERALTGVGRGPGRGCRVDRRVRDAGRSSGRISRVDVVHCRQEMIG
jgi:hypothetical protein